MIKMAEKILMQGEWEDSETEKTKDVLSPETNEILGKVQLCSQQEIDKSLKDLGKVQKEWKNIPKNKRAEFLKKVSEKIEEKKEHIGKVMSKEIAKPLKSAIKEVKRTADFVDYTSEKVLTDNKELFSGEDFPGEKSNKYGLRIKEPLGIVLAINPFNYPVNLLGSKIAPALATGNVVIAKPAFSGSLSSLQLCKIFHETAREFEDIPNGILSCITGKSSEIGDYLITHEKINMISFTGSTQVGERISEKTNMIPLQLELGGKDPAIVLEDSDLDKASEEIVQGAFSYNGQRCTAIKRVIVKSEIADELIEKIKEKVSSLSVGRASENSKITSMISKESADFVQELYNDAIKNNAKNLFEFNRKENLIYPNILYNVDNNMRIYYEEQFGPLLPVIRVDSIEEAIETANDSNFGLQASVFTKDTGKFFKISKSLEVGTIHLNSKTQRGPDNFPFLGVKKSGFGVQGIKDSIESMTKDKVIVVNF